MKKPLLLRLVACVMLLALVLCGTACRTVPRDDNDEHDLEAQSLAELLFYLREVAYFQLPDSVDPTGMSRKELVEAIGDRHAYYFTAEEYAAYASDLGGNLVGIGISITQYKDSGIEGIHVLSVFPDSPAEEAGLAVRDVIVGINGNSITSLGYANALDMVAGEAGTSLTLTILRDGETQDVILTRNHCTKKTVHSRLLTVGETDIGYIYITEFDAVTSYQFIMAVTALEQAGVDRWLFDLRGNPGGYLHTVCQMLAFALPDGNICSVDYRYEQYADYTISSSGDQLLGVSNTVLPNGSALPVSHSFAGTPIGVLIDGGSASAAELFTSALRDYGTAGLLDVTIFGAKSYGKGSMQSAIRLSNGDYVKLTLALYNPPSGINYDGVGIFPSDGGLVETEPTSVTSRFFGEYTEIVDIDAAMYLALTTLAN